MVRKYSKSVGLSLIIILTMNFQAAHATGLSRITSASCNGLTIQGTSNQPYVSVIVSSEDLSTVLGVSDGAVVAGPSTLIPVGLVPVAQDGTFTAYVPFRNGDFTVGPVASGTSMLVVVDDYSSLTTTISSEIAEISLSVVCPQAGDPAIPVGYIGRVGLCTTYVFDKPNGKQLSTYMVGSKQTLFANPKSQQDDYGKPWAEIFIAKGLTAYIPNSCVG